MRVPPQVIAPARAAAPYAILIAFGLGAVVVAGAHYSNAYPSEARPFGWSGPASFENAIAMVRTELILAASLPALILGARALRDRDPTESKLTELLTIYGVHAGLLTVAVALAGRIGSIGAGPVVSEAVVAFWVAHSVLAVSFYSLGFMWSSLVREHALAAGMATWMAFVTLHEAVTRTILFRTEGYHKITAGSFPDWFWASQVFSPLSSYTGILILWREGFRNTLERTSLAKANLPDWFVPATFLALGLLMWVLVPLAIGLGAWWWRGVASRRRTASASAEWDNT